MDHKPAILAAAHHLAFDVKPEMRRLIERGMKRAKRHDHAAFRRLVERELALLIESFRHLVPREVLAQRMHTVGPTVRENQPLRITMSHRLDADEVAKLALGPIRRGHYIGDAVHLRMLGRQMRENAAQQVSAVEGEVVRNHELAGERPVIRADADNVAGVEVAEEILANRLERGWLDEDEQATLARQVGPLDGGTESSLQLSQYLA